MAGGSSKETSFEGKRYVKNESKAYTEVVERHLRDSKPFVFGPDDEYASITEKSRRLFVVSKQDFDSATCSPILSLPLGA